MGRGCADFPVCEKTAGEKTRATSEYDASGRLIEKFALGVSEGISLAISGDQLVVGLVTRTGSEVARFSTAGERPGAIDMDNLENLSRQQSMW